MSTVREVPTAIVNSDHLCYCLSIGMEPLAEARDRRGGAGGLGRV
jgi:hypothetical protein